MPSLRFLGRRWRVNGDEFTLPAALAATGRLLYICLIAVLLAVICHHLEDGCTDTNLTIAYGVVSILVYAALAIVEIRITRLSLYGTITDMTPRHGLKHLLRTQTWLVVFQLPVTLCGIALLLWLLSVPGPCGASRGSGVGHSRAALLTVLIASQWADILGWTCCYCVLTGPEDDTDYMPTTLPALGRDRGGSEDFQREVEGTCRTLCKWAALCTCDLFGGGSMEADFAHVSRVLARLFHTGDYLDLVASDVLAGIVLLRHVQKAQDYQLKAQYVSQTSSAMGDSSSQENPLISTNSDRPPAPFPVAYMTPPHGAQHMARSPDPPPPPPPGGLGGAAGGGVLGGLLGPLSPGLSPPLGGTYWRQMSSASSGPDMRRFYKVYGKRAVDPACKEDMRDFEEAVHFARYSVAIYTWMLYLFSSPCTGCCDLCCYSLCCMNALQKKRWAKVRHEARAALRPGETDIEAEDDHHGPPKVMILGDDMCGAHQAALLRVAGVHPDCELVSAHFSNGINETPYCVLVDHAWQSVVVAVRGTLSLEDCIIDAMAEPASLEECGHRWGFDGTGIMAHGGVKQRAEWIMADLDHHGVLRALLVPGEWRKFQGTGEKEGLNTPLAEVGRYCSGYTLRITGHSLGAGVAAVLALMLRGQHPTVRCISVSPPGGLLSKEVAASMSEYCTSVVLGNDIIPRMSLQSTENLRDQILEMVGRAKVNKLTVMRSLLDGRHAAMHLPDYLRDEEEGGGGGTEETGGERMSAGVPIPYRIQLDRYKAHLADKRSDKMYEITTNLRPPGRLLHLIKTDHRREGASVFRSSVYTPVWTQAEQFQEILVSRSMLADHLPDNVLAALESTFKRLSL